MLRSMKELVGYRILAIDDDIGHVDDFYFDDETWVIRYMVVDTGNWLPGRKVLISPLVLGRPDWEMKRFPVNLTKTQVKNSPNINVDQPVARQQEIELLNYYDWPHYWDVSPIEARGTGMHPSAYLSAKRVLENPTDSENGADALHQEGDPHLRSVDEVTGYYIQATDDNVGHVEDFIVDDQTLAIQYMVVDTRNWLPGRKVLVSRSWIKAINWGKTAVTVDLTKDAIKESPEYDPTLPINREYETKLYDYHGRPTYWS